jgi:acyl-ACP thioesterase
LAVTAGTERDYSSVLENNGLVQSHAYSVVAYDADKDMVRLRNPWESNPTFWKNDNQKFHLGYDDADNPNHVNNGYFWMKLSDFTTEYFSTVYYQTQPN